MKLRTSILLFAAMAALSSCKKEFTSDRYLNPGSDDVVSIETRNTYLYKEVFTGIYDSIPVDSTNGTFYFNIDSLPVDSQYYYRLTSVRNKINDTEVPQYVTEFYFDTASTMHYQFISWYDYSAPYAGTTYGRTAEGWKITFYNNTDTMNNYTVQLYFKEYGHVGMPLPPME